MPTISVVLATYNGGKYLEEQLSSIISQTRLPDELVVSDDGSTDTTVATAEQFRASAPFPVHVGEGPQKGLAANFLTGVDRASCDRIAFADQDDVWLPDKLAVLSAAMDRTGSVMATHGAITVDAALKPLRTGYGNVRRQRLWEPFEANMWRSVSGNAMMFDRSLLDGVDWAHRPEVQWGPGELLNHDDLVAILAAIMGRNVRIPDRPLLYRQHGGNAAGAPEAGIPANRRSAASYVDYVRHRERVAERWADWFTPLVGTERRTAAARYFRAASRNQRRRAETLEATGATAWKRYFQHTLSGDYRTDADGLGWKGFVRDGHHLALKTLSSLS